MSELVVTPTEFVQVYCTPHYTPIHHDLCTGLSTLAFSTRERERDRPSALLINEEDVETIADPFVAVYYRVHNPGTADSYTKIHACASIPPSSCACRVLASLFALRLDLRTRLDEDEDFIASMFLVDDADADPALPKFEDKLKEAVRSFSACRSTAVVVAEDHQWLYQMLALSKARGNLVLTTEQPLGWAGSNEV